MMGVICLLGALAASATPPLPVHSPGVARSLAERLQWKDGDLSLSLRGWILTDLIALPRAEATFGPSWNVQPFLRSARLSAAVGLPDALSARLTLELGEINSDVQELWAGYSAGEWLTLRAGRLKVPFGMTQQLALAARPLLEAPLVAGNAKDFYDHGLAGHGTWAGGRILYALGTVSGTRTSSVDVNEQPDLVARVVMCPFGDDDAHLGRLTLGGSGSYGRGPLRNGSRVRTPGEHTVAPPPTIRGVQERLGGELSFRQGRVSLNAEYQWLRQHRSGLTSNASTEEGLHPIGDLAPYVVRGWYVEGSWLLAGETGLPIPKYGVELAARVERLRFGDGTDRQEVGETAVDHAPLLDSSVTGFTTGLSVYSRTGLRLTVAWQQLRFGRADTAPNQSPGASTSDGAGVWVGHCMARLGLAIL